MIELKDQMGRLVSLPDIPKKIISLVPSQTEFLYDLELHDEVIGITKFCIHPKAWFRSKQRIGGTKNVDHDLVNKLQPDLIIGNKEENTKGDIESLSEKYPVYMSDVLSITSACEMMTDIGKLVGKEEKARNIVKKITNDLESLPKLNGKVLYFMWKNPFMVAGKATFIGQVLEKIGFENLFSEYDGRYREISEEEIMGLAPDYCLLSTEPFPYKATDEVTLSQKWKISCKVVDGEMFSWYGSRMLKMKEYFTELVKSFEK